MERMQAGGGARGASWRQDQRFPPTALRRTAVSSIRLLADHLLPSAAVPPFKATQTWPDKSLLGKVIFGSEWSQQGERGEGGRFLQLFSGILMAQSTSSATRGSSTNKVCQHTTGDVFVFHRGNNKRQMNEQDVAKRSHHAQRP